jgi:hypothetical protein
VIRPLGEPAAKLAIALRQAESRRGDVAAALADRTLARGAGFTREELTAEIIERTGSAHLEDVLGSGWGTLLKPLAWWGVLCFGPPKGNRVTFVSATWLPKASDAAPTVVRAFLGAYGPATPELFDKVWLSRGRTRKSVVRSWFEALGDELAEVDVEGEQRVMLAEHVEELLVAEPSGTVRLLGAFDAYVLGSGTTATEIVPAERRAVVSRAGGWISPVVLHGGRVAGVWGEGGGTLWEEVPQKAIDAELSRHASVMP